MNTRHAVGAVLALARHLRDALGEAGNSAGREALDDICLDLEEIQTAIQETGHE